MYIQENSKFKMKDGWVGRGKLFRVPKLPKLLKAQNSKATSVTQPSMTLDVNIPNLWPCKRGNYISCSKRRCRNIEWKLITKRCWCGGKGFLIESKILVNPAGGSLDHGASNLRDQHRNDRSSAPEQTFHKTFYGFQILRSDCVSIKHFYGSRSNSGNAVLQLCLFS